MVRRFIPFCLMLFTFGIANPLLWINAVSAAQTLQSVEQLGQLLYFDPNLSLNRTQSCSTCHAPQDGFVDVRKNSSESAVSLGDDGLSLGDRNAPTATYARFSPSFHKNRKGKFVGGQFYDGRAANLTEQAEGPPLNPVEMGMPSKQAVVNRLQENPTYIQAFKQFYGETIFSNPDRAYTAMANSIATFEKSDFFAPFDSKYDRHLRGEYTMTREEDLGMALFFSKQFTNCNLCHQLKRFPGQKGETFSNYQYHNIGTPINQAVRALNGKGSDFIDHGLLDNPKVNDPSADGKIKVPTLRNVAVTGPYMHNGVFKDLRTVVLFYNQYNTNVKQDQINPETGKPWRAPEVAGTISWKELQTGPALSDKKIDALVAFLKTLTDQRYEH